MFDWYQTFQGCKEIITDYCKMDSRILNIGCGNSNLSFDMYKHGYKNIVNMDWSDVAIRYMKEKYKDISELKCNFLQTWL